MSAPLESKTPKLAANCLVCGIPLVGLTAVFLRWRGIRRSPRNPNCCTQCGAHLEEGRVVEMTVVFADLSSFTEMTGRLGATTTYSVVDEFLRLASATLTSHGALIDKYIGDAVMALFNVPIKRADHAAAAVAAAAKLQEVLPELSARLGMPLQASIGIASGFSRVGRLGSDDIKDYTAIGDAVNQAARLQAQAGPTEILVSQNVYREIASAYPGVPAESLVLKGFPQRTVAYRLNGKPRSVLSAASWMPEDRPAMNWSAMTLALLGSGCLGSNVAAAMVLAFGGGAAGALYTFARWFDSSPARVPLLILSTLVASIVLVSLERQRRMRRDCVARRSCLEMTRQEKRHVRLAAGLAVVSLMLIAVEVLLHYVIGHPLVTRPSL
jgi:adenylate cyclase